MAALRMWKVEVEVHQHRDVPLLLLVLAHEKDDSGGVSDNTPKPQNPFSFMRVRLLNGHLSIK
jgi:hypothetical protein